MTLLTKTLQAVIKAWIWLSSAAVLAMIAITFVDITLRMLRVRFIGAMDLMQIAGVISIAAALPYTTAVNGHVAIEFFFHKLSHRGRLVLGSLLKTMTLALFAFTSYQCWIYGNNLRDNNQVTMTLHVPQCWMMYLISVSLAMVVLVVLYSLLFPNRELMKP